jgi:hypothetical protein
MTVEELIKRLQEIPNTNKAVYIVGDVFYGKFVEAHKITEYSDKIVIE